MDLSALLETERAKIGDVIGISPWHLIDQARIDAFADVTGDHQFIHVDQEAAAAGPFGATIAHGFLTLSLTATMAPEALDILPGQKLFVNYGFEKIRFLNPVPSGGRVRAHFKLAEVAVRGPSQMLHTFEVTVELEGSDKPALVATWLSLGIFGDM